MRGRRKKKDHIWMIKIIWGKKSGQIAIFAKWQALTSYEYTYEVNYIIYSRKREDHILGDLVQLGIRIRKDLDLNVTSEIILYDKDWMNLSFHWCVTKTPDGMQNLKGEENIIFACPKKNAYGN